MYYKKIHSLTIILFFLCSYTVCLGENYCDNITPNDITRHIPVSGTIVSKRSVNDLCEVILKVRQEYIPVYVTPKYIIAGEMFQNKTQVSGNKIEKLKADQSLLFQNQLNKCVSIRYRPEKSIRSIYVITDPECSYCNKANRKIKKIADDYNAELKIILYSVHGMAGQKKAIEAICRNLNFDQYAGKNWMKKNKSDEYQCKKGNKIFAQTKKIINEFGMAGVPMFLLDDGTKIVGANMPALIKALNLQKLKTDGNAK